MFRRRRDAEDPGSGTRVAPGENDPRTAAAGRARELGTELAGIVAQADRDGARLPPGAVPVVRDIDDVLRPLLRYIEARSAQAEELRNLTAIISDYLPRALGDYLALPARYAERPGLTGSSPADDLLRQLVLLDEGVNELQDLVYTGDAAKLAIQARFLDSKFRRSDLDLD
ncbi:hypothetical protein [Pseudofrankia inefficax]|uniref:Uncharacterized protein n=1 Tax=Pseudofrankia inefficax (strain DSM 45817 / CECT 9037 / DDB 130130 / EuI1c) TaxID=298654 RepID=E3J5S3_PSEI1|nr:hypothetical protein [Pseudofrankia inefficax]ADP83160.1 hypothetical protein FraEuI1c_5171 [Pseudofrankia inefficax]